MTGLIKRNNFGSLLFPTLLPEYFFSDLDRFFSQSLPKNIALNHGFPKGDVFIDDNGSAVVELMMAGYPKECLSVDVVGDTLTVKAEFKQEDKAKRGQSRTCKSFKREFVNSANEFNLEKAEVSYMDGLLKIVIPPSEPIAEQVKSLPIK